MTIDEMPAGTELDDIIAIEVFGCDPWNARIDPSNQGGRRQFHWGYPVGHDFAPAYSTDIAAAWQVVDNLKTHDTILSASGREGDDSWCVRLGYCDEEGQKHWASAPTLPLAICRAALKVVRAGGAA
jgi:hypothetical protein